ncbi:MAG: hypothetical protein K2L71_01360 [Muribaculaceae bacterium]|nr:hypothetical protein [Muribaculaceae bacterium]
MEVRLGFDELEEYVEAHYGQRMTFGKVDRRTVSVGLIRRMLFKERQFNVSLVLESASDTEITFTYGASAALELLMRIALNYMARHKPDMIEAVCICPGQRLKLNLAKVPRAVALVESLAFESIAVEEDCFLVGLSLR